MKAANKKKEDLKSLSILLGVLVVIAIFCFIFYQKGMSNQKRDYLNIGYRHGFMDGQINCTQGKIFIHRDTTEYNFNKNIDLRILYPYDTD